MRAKGCLGTAKRLDKPRRGVAQPGSAFVWGTKGRRFKSGHSDHFFPSGRLLDSLGFPRGLLRRDVLSELDVRGPVAEAVEQAREGDQFLLAPFTQ